MCHTKPGHNGRDEAAAAATTAAVIASIGSDTKAYRIDNEFVCNSIQIAKPSVLVFQGNRFSIRADRNDMR
jgi:hypothetical protein